MDSVHVDYYHFRDFVSENLRPREEVLYADFTPMALDPNFEIEQIERYIDYVSRNTVDLGRTVESSFFPMLQRIFFYRAYEVRQNVEFNGRSYPFDCIDVLNRRRRILVHFGYTEGKVATFPGFALEWGAEQTTADYPSLLVIQNRSLYPEVQQVASARRHLVSSLDFDGLKIFAREGVGKHIARQASRSVRIVQEFMDALAIEVAKAKIALADIEWRDLERLLGAIFQALGYRCITTPPAKDGGRDLVVCEITRDDVAWFNIELKHWRDRRSMRVQSNTAWRQRYERGGGGPS